VSDRTRDLVGALARAGVEVDASGRRRAEYSYDASLYRVPPLAVAFPRDADDVAAAVDVARAHGVPVTPRGGGTSIAGNAVGPGLVIDLSRRVDRIGAIDVESRTARVDPGVVLDDLQRAAAPHGLRFGPDPSTHDRCSLGGMIGNNACGSRALGFGRTVDHVRSLDLVTGDGRRLRVGDGADAAGRELTERAVALVADHAELVRARLGRFSRQVSGYGLHHLLPEHGEDLARALVGTEGTAGVVVAATLGLVEVPPVTALVVLGYPDMVAAADAVPGLLAHRLVALEGLDARIVDVVRRSANGVVPELPPGSGWLFAEVPAGSVGEARAASDAVVRDAAALGHRVVLDAAEAKALWRIREAGSGLITRGHGTTAHAGWEDAAVPPERLGEYLRAFDGLLGEHGLEGVPYGHFGDGCVHVRITFPLGREGGRETFRTFLHDAATLVTGFGGSLSGEHGDGRARSELLAVMYDQPTRDLFAAFKALLDPGDVMNPGVIVRPRPVDADLRTEVPIRLATSGGFSGLADGGLAAGVTACVGVGRCRTHDRGEGSVMCPTYAATGDERDSTRGRARVLQEMINGGLGEAGWSAPEVEESLDLCLACKGCASDCPTGVDMATYRSQVLHERYRGRLRPLTHYTLGWLPRWTHLASRVPRLAALLTAPGPLTRVGALIAGIDRRRSVPRFAPRTLRGWFASRTDAPSDLASRPRVMLFVDTFTDAFRPEVGEAAVRVLEDAGLAVELSPPTGCCALTWISTGQLDAARSILRRTIDGLDAAASAGVPIVGLEPSCTATLRSDARELLGEEDAAAARVAAATRTLAEVLATRRPAWQPPRLDGERAVVQPHCHQHAVLGFGADRGILAACGVDVEVVGGCCGLAGNFGVERGHYEVSVAVAENELMPAVRGLDGEGTVLTDGFSCQLQVGELAGRRGEHLAELLDRGLRARDAAGRPQVR
jgi:FAD/FMN-containing dehydrogenase/Fe-S oxidoreductase